MTTQEYPGEVKRCFNIVIGACKDRDVCFDRFMQMHGEEFLTVERMAAGKDADVYAVRVQEVVDMCLKAEETNDDALRDKAVKLAEAL